MMAENPAAFPSVCLDDPCHPSSVSGMSLRDWFAGQALASFNAAYRNAEGDARKAYAIADAMLAERQRRSA